MTAKVLIIVGDATETVDTLYPYLRVQEEGFAPVVAGPEARRYNMVLHEVPAEGWDITREFEGYTIQADIAFRHVVPEEYVGIFFSGGRAPEYIRDDPDLIRITRYFFDRDKPVGCICHGVETKSLRPNGRSQYPPVPVASKGGAWPPCPSANSTSKSAAAPLSTRPASSMATSSAVALGTTTGTT